MTTYILIAIFISAILTFFLRGVAFIAFSGDRHMPKWLKGLGEILPSAIMAVLIVYCLRGARDDFAGVGIAGVAAAIVTAVLHKWKHNTFISIIAGTVIYMLLIRL